MLLALCVALSRRMSTTKPHQLTVTLKSTLDVFWWNITYIKTLERQNLNFSPAVQKIAQLCDTFVEIMQNAMKLLVVILIGSMVLYLVRALDTKNAYATHIHTYAWFWTLAYMRGVVPAVLLLILWAGTITVCFCRIIVHPRRRNDKPPQTTTPPPNTTTESVSHRDLIVSVCAAFIFNTSITIVVNVLYIYSTQQASFRLFSTLWYTVELVDLQIGLCCGDLSTTVSTPPESS